MQWNTLVAADLIRNIKNKKKRLVYLMTGTVGIVGVALGYVFTREKPGEQKPAGEEDIPLPDVPTPDGN